MIQTHAASENVQAVQPRQQHQHSPPSPPSHQQQQQYLQAGATSPGVTFSDDQYEQYDSDIDNDMELGPSRETLQEGQIVKSGYLHKKGERIKIWKKRWFVLRTSKLAYYKDSKEYELLRIVDIRDVHRAAEVVVKNRTGVFVILTPKRTFTVQADSVADMEEWIKAINQTKVQYELTSSSDIDSFSGSSPQLLDPLHPNSQSRTIPSSPLSAKPELVKQGSGTLLPRRQQAHPLSLSDPGLLTGTETGTGVGSSGLSSPRHMSPPASSPLSRPLEAQHGNSSNGGNNNHKVSGLSLGLMSQSMGQMPSGSISPLNNNGPITNTSRVLQQPQRNDPSGGLSLITSNTQAIRIGGSTSPASPPRNGFGSGNDDEGPLANSFSSNYSLNNVPGTPSSLGGYGSGGEQFGTSANANNHASSGEEEDDGVVDDPCFLEAGRVAAEANMPGSGLVTNEQLESKVVRQGYLLKLGNTYKTWRKKWFVLRGDKLTYYKNQKEYQPHGIIPLSTIIDCLQTDPVSKHKQYCLRIVTSKRSFVCCAPDEDTLLQWLDALHVECARVAREKELQDQDPSPLVAPLVCNNTDSNDMGDSVLSAMGSTNHPSTQSQPPLPPPLPRSGSSSLMKQASSAAVLGSSTGPSVTFQIPQASAVSSSPPFQSSSHSPPAVTFST
ncbi:hypothetical protein EMPS_08093 [Entomortierella parvispora]|uniref:PH domain-containing protein n=1 Tax=Entomortierella parvispora TaxID=205924 RepID=A0A9P3HFE3_9FUNG|nr:hypothetical protein EMPS_08093 [Entomortierella parvispora]